MKSKVAIVILNWNGIVFIKKFLPSVCLFAEEAEVVVIDNASCDESLEYITENYPQIKTITLDKNYGFAGGYNKGLEQVEADIYILLNSDVEVTKGWWQPLVDLLETKSEIVAVQPKILSFHNKHSFEYAGACGGFIDKYGYPFCRGRILDTVEKDEGQYNESIPIFWATGAAIAIKSDIFHNNGGFDATFFAHMEEIDLCWRLQNLGYKIYCEPKSVIYHVGGGTLPNESPFKLYLNFRNSLSMLYKNLPAKNFYSIFLTRMILDGIASLKFLLSGSPKKSFSILKAHISFYKKLKSLREQRIYLEKNRKKVAEVYKKSILWEYFFRKNKHFSKISTK